MPMTFFFIQSPMLSDATTIVATDSIESGLDGVPSNYNNPAYDFETELPPLNLPNVTSNVPVLFRSFGWIRGG